MRFVASVCALGTLFAPTLVFGAEEVTLGRSGQWTIGAERLMSFTSSTQTEGVGDAQVETSVNATAVFTSLSPGPYNFPRFAFDYFLVDGISIGGSFIFGSDTFESRGGTGEPFESTRNVLAFNTRVGYALMFDPANGLWLRLGFTAFSESIEKVSKLEGTAIDLEAFYVWSPAPYVAVMTGFVVDEGLAGNRSYDDGRDPVEVSTSNVGLTVGLLAYF